jgi:uncharacterized membrane protein
MRRGEGTTGLFERAESAVSALVSWLQLGIEVLGAAIIALGVVVAVVTFARVALARQHAEADPRVRLILARYLALALELQLAADILATAIAPSWDAIGRLGAVAVIRTGLNYFLNKEMENEAALVAPIAPVGSSAAGEREAPGTSERA